MHRVNSKIPYYFTYAAKARCVFSHLQRWSIDLLCGFITIYRYTFSFLVGRQCRHWPTCSEYTAQALRRHGIWAGFWISLARLSRCRPWGTWGIDCVPTLLPIHAAYYRPWTYGRWKRVYDPQPSEESDTVGSPIIALTFPDGASREYPKGVTGTEVAKSISPSLAKKVALMAIDGAFRDLNDSLEAHGNITFFKRDDETLLSTLRHDCAHILAEAVQNLFPCTQVTIGPAIDNGFYYDFYREKPFTPEDLPLIEAEMRKIVARDEPFVKEVWTREQALEWFRKKGETFKCELIESIPETEPLTIYRQGTWLDLCRGPHMRSTGQVGNAFKLTHVAGAYWRGDSNRPMLTRIYGTAFASQEALEAYLKQREEAEKRDHRRLGREMDLFHFQEEGPGTVFWHPKGWSLFQTLLTYMRRQQDKNGYKEVNTPQLLDRVLWEKSGHWEKFQEHMFITHTDDERCFALKPMNCPGHVHIFRQGSKSYRDLPERICEFGIVHRYEPSGAIHGLMRVRAFTQDDAHIFCTEDQLFDEGCAANNLLLSIYRDFGFSDILIKLSTRPEKRIGSDKIWDEAEGALGHILKNVAENPPEGCTIKTQINPGEGAFYGPKLEYALRDAIGREWQCGTIQVDFNLPGRLDAVYTDCDGVKKHPVMLHRALFGSLERFIGILLEHFAGHLPLWLSPVQGVVCSITDEVAPYAQGICALAKELGLKLISDVRNEKISYKVREHMIAKVPLVLVVGHRERDERLVTLRRLGSSDSTTYPLDEALELLVAEAQPPDLES